MAKYQQFHMAQRDAVGEALSMVTALNEMRRHKRAHKGQQQL